MLTFASREARLRSRGSYDSRIGPAPRSESWNLKSSRRSTIPSLTGYCAFAHSRRGPELHTASPLANRTATIEAPVPGTGAVIVDREQRRVTKRFKNLRTRHWQLQGQDHAGDAHTALQNKAELLDKGSDTRIYTTRSLTAAQQRFASSNSRRSSSALSPVLPSWTRRSR